MSSGPSSDKSGVKLKFSRSKLHRLWILGALSVCFGLFQNMSLDERLREMDGLIHQSGGGAPAYIPDHLNGSTPQAIGQELLKHNFREPMESLQSQVERWTTSGDDKAQADASRDPASAAERKRKAKWRAGVMGSGQMGWTVEHGFRVRCELLAQDGGLQLSYDQPLGQGARLSVRHRTDAQQSSVGFSYNW